MSEHGKKEQVPSSDNIIYFLYIFLRVQHPTHVVLYIGVLLYLLRLPVGGCGESHSQYR